MKFDTTLLTTDLAAMPDLTRRAEALGFDGLWVSETAHDGFFPLVLAAEHSHTLTLGNSIAVAFARAPGALASMAWDLARYSQGRFVLGLGPQVKAHNERRLGVPWGRPVQRMRETVLALRAFWDCWQHGTALEFRGEFFRLDLMSPFFNPGAHAYPQVPIYLAAVNRAMLQLAGELCQGVHVHPLHTPRYLQEVVIPQVEAGAKRTGRSLDDVALSSSVFVVPTDDPEREAAYERDARRQIAFYASTPNYRVVFETHGWANVAERLSRHAARGRWDELPGLITDEILDAFAVRGAWAALPALLNHKYDGLLDRLSYYFPFQPGENEAGWQASLEGFRNL